MAQGKQRNKNSSNKGSKNLNKKKKQMQKKNNKSKSNFKTTFAKLPTIKKSQLNNKRISSSINNKNHDIAVRNALRNGEKLNVVSTSRKTHQKKFIPKE
mmetsp:Transcript_57552/g.95608  ORF Transcript_57552/g.95608 Transcript_57552/m.95608 type:complete len:99 (+) Transcript_57552:24-320(+)